MQVTNGLTFRGLYKNDGAAESTSTQSFYKPYKETPDNIPHSIHGTEQQVQQELIAAHDLLRNQKQKSVF
jgi:hypothetical protein